MPYNDKYWSKIHILTYFININQTHIQSQMFSVSFKLIILREQIMLSLNLYSLDQKQPFQVKIHIMNLLLAKTIQLDSLANPLKINIIAELVNLYFLGKNGFLTQKTAIFIRKLFYFNIIVLRIFKLLKYSFALLIMAFGVVQQFGFPHIGISYP